MQAGLLEDKPAAGQPQQDVEEAQDQRHVEGGEASTGLRGAQGGGHLVTSADPDGGPLADVVRAGVVLDVTHALGPCTRARKPEQRQQCCQAQVQDGHGLVLRVHLAREEVDAQDAHTVQEGQHTGGHEELRVACKVERQLNGLHDHVRVDGARFGHLEGEVGHPEGISKLYSDLQWA